MREKDIIINKRMKDMGEEEEIEAMRYVMLPRKKRELYKAMQLGLAKKEARAAQLEERKKKLKSEGKYGHDADEKRRRRRPRRRPRRRRRRRRGRRRSETRALARRRATKQATRRSSFSGQLRPFRVLKSSL